MKLDIAVIYGSVRSSRQGIKAAKFIINKLKERKHKVTLVDPKEFKLPMLDKMYKEYTKGKAPAAMEKLAKILIKADAYVIVSGEYNHGVPPTLKNLLDTYQTEYYFKPSAVVTYSTGSFGGVRVLAQLRQIAAELGMPSIPSSFPIPRVQESFDGKGNATDKAYNRRIVAFLDELEWYASAFKTQKKEGTPY
jgi:NAD(P)H-dependent FMN reductase